MFNFFDIVPHNFLQIYFYGFFHLVNFNKNITKVYCNYSVC
jgi:hypothetical protein